MFQAIVDIAVDIGRIPRALAQLVAGYARDDAFLAAEVLGRNQPNSYKFKLDGRDYSISFGRVDGRFPTWRTHLTWSHTKHYHIRIYVHDSVAHMLVSNHITRYDEAIQRIIDGPAHWTTDGVHGAALRRLHTELECIWSGP